MEIFAKLTIDKKSGKIIGFRFTDETIRKITDIEFFKNIKARVRAATPKIIA